MTQISQATKAVAAVCDRDGPDAPRMEAYLRNHGLEARWHALRDLDDVDREVCAGRAATVVFVHWQGLLEGIWNGEVSFDRWLELRAELRFVESPGESATDYLASVSRAWSAHKRARRRRQMVSGVVLSLIALISAFLVVQQW